MAAPERFGDCVAERNIANPRCIHAVFETQGATATLSLSAGVHHQGVGGLDGDQCVLPGLGRCQMDIGLDGTGVDNPRLSNISSASRLMNRG